MSNVPNVTPLPRTDYRSDDMSEFSHLNESGEAQMVDVGDKDVTQRRAVARGYIYMQRQTLQRVLDSEIEKGEVTQVARVAGIMGAKETSDLIPLCHQIPLDNVAVRFQPREDVHALEIEAEASCGAKTGVEMEALTGVSVAALTIYDMCKGVDSTMHIGEIHLVSKTGGRSGDFEHPHPPTPSKPDHGDGEGEEG